jgi:hypothetical protein
MKRLDLIINSANRFLNTLLRTFCVAFLTAVATWMVRNAPAQTTTSTPNNDVRILRSGAEQLVVKTAEVPPEVSFSGGVAGTWLVVRRSNVRDYEQRAFDPCYTEIVSDFRPVAKRRPDGKWLIQFETESAR